MTRGRSFFALSASVLAGLVLSSVSLFAQAPAAVAQSPDTSQAKHWTFDVVSIRPSTGGGGMSWGIGPVGYGARSAPLATTILNAYFPRARQARNLIVGAPDWVWKESYDFTGKVSGEDAAEWRHYREDPASMDGNPMLQSMLQAALVERCGLQVRREPGTMRGYALVLQKKGVNHGEVRESSAALPDLPAIKVPLAGGGFLIPIPRSAPVPQAGYVHVTMAVFANQLSGFVGAPVIDRTGLTGTYDFNLARLPVEPGDSVTSPEDRWDFQKLGLRLEPTDIPVETVVITHIDKPDAN